MPLTKLINVDLSILQRFYKNKVPGDLEEESHNFSYIIDGHYDQFKSTETSINSKLLESVRHVDSRICQNVSLLHEHGESTSSLFLCPPNSSNLSPNEITNMWQPEQPYLHHSNSIYCGDTGTSSSSSTLGVAQMPTPNWNINPSSSSL